MKTSEKPKITKKDQKAIDREIKRYLRTGNHDVQYLAWPSGNLFERAEGMCVRLKDALITEVQNRESRSGKICSPLPSDFNVQKFARKKVLPMVTGLFPAKERETVLEILQDSLVFLTKENIERVLRQEEWQYDAWTLANIYLGSIGAKCLDEKPYDIVGVSRADGCFVSMNYFEQADPFADFVVHEAAHVFHNLKRERVELPYTRNKEWLLQIAFAKREQFAYACEAYSRILEQSASPAERRILHVEYSRNSAPSDDERIDHGELIDILAEAVAARNGWKRILNRCTTP